MSFTFGKSIHSLIGCIKCSFVTLGVALTFLSFSYTDSLMSKRLGGVAPGGCKKFVRAKKRKNRSSVRHQIFQCVVKSVQICYSFIPAAFFFSFH